MPSPEEHEPDLRRRGERARAESRRLRSDSLRTQRRAAQLVITAQRLVGEALVLVLEGALDRASAPTVVDELTARRVPGEVVRIDLAGVDFMDAYSLGALLDLTAPDGSRPGRVELERPSDAGMRVVEITGTAEMLGLPWSR